MYAMRMQGMCHVLVRTHYPREVNHYFQIPTSGLRVEWGRLSNTNENLKFQFQTTWDSWTGLALYLPARRHTPSVNDILKNFGGGLRKEERGGIIYVGHLRPFI